MALPFEIMVIITISWVLFGAVKLMPHFAEKRMTRKGGRIDTLEKGFNDRLDILSESLTGVESRVESKISRIGEKIEAIKIPEIPPFPEIPPYPEMPNIPDNIPDMDQITKLIEDGRANTVEVLNDVQIRLSNNMQSIDANIPAHISTGIKQMEGRLYKAKGISQHDHEKGIDAAKEVILHDLDNTEDKTPIMRIVRHFVQVAADAELIDPENADQKIGLVQGILEGVKMFQSNGNSPQGGNNFSFPRNASLPLSQGNEFDGYYR